MLIECRSSIDWVLIESQSRVLIKGIDCHWTGNACSTHYPGQLDCTIEIAALREASSTWQHARFQSLSSSKSNI